jgi:hypothetical protein
MRRSIKTNLLSAIAVTLLSTFVASSICHGLDTDLYVLSGVDIPVNVVVIFDTSASMGEVTSGQAYDPTIDYSLYSPATVYPKGAVYYKSGKNWGLWRQDYVTISCPGLQDVAAG